MNGTIPHPTRRPLFLSILCVVTWCLCAWMIAENCLNLFTDKPQRAVEEMRAQLAHQAEKLGPEAATDPLYAATTEGQLKMVEQGAEHKVPMALLSLIYTFLIAAATWLMWGLRKKGFWLLLAAQVAGFCLPFLWIKPTVVSILMFGIVGLLWAGHAVLFALQLKHMR